MNPPPPTPQKDRMSEDETPPLDLDVPVSLPKPSAWSGGKPDGSRLTEEQRAEIYQRHMDGQSTFKIAREMKHGRNTIAALLKPDDPAVGEHLQATRKARQLHEEEDLLRLRREVLEDKAEAGKLSVADLNSAVMIAGIGIKESGGAAPQRIRVEVDVNHHLAAQVFSGQFKPAPLVMEAEVIAPVREMTNDE